MFRICNRINNFNVYAFYHKPETTGHFLTVSMTLWPLCKVDIKAVFVFVSDANAHHSERLESVSPTDRQGRDALDFYYLSGCEQLVHCPTHIAGYRLDLVMTDVLDIIYVVVGTPLGTSDHCIVSCVLRVEQSCLSNMSEVQCFYSIVPTGTVYTVQS